MYWKLNTTKIMIAPLIWHYSLINTDWDSEEERAFLLWDHKRECDRVRWFTEPFHARTRCIVYGWQLFNNSTSGVEEVGPEIRLHPHSAGTGCSWQRHSSQPGPYQQLPVWSRAWCHWGMCPVKAHSWYLSDRRCWFCSSGVAPIWQLR